MGRTFGYREGDLPHTEDLSRRLLRLPFYPDLTGRQVDHVAGAVASYFDAGRRTRRRERRAVFSEATA
jgi:dTDP-4-amino-4,6-dideoxygalactose transaminase